MAASIFSFLFRAAVMSATTLIALPQPAPSSAAPAEGIALAIVYDTSGSMLEPVKDQSGNPTPKYLIANRSLNTIIGRLQRVAFPGEGAPPTRIESGLVVFGRDTAKVAVPFGPFDAELVRRWLQGFSRPQGSTPLGTAIQTASEAVLKSKLPRKHVLILTDGNNTQGPAPHQVLPKINAEATRLGAAVGFHFVAFDVDARVFDAVKKLGATVLGATDESQLNTQLEFILEEKILLEAEEPAPKKSQPR